MRSDAGSASFPRDLALRSRVSRSPKPRLRELANLNFADSVIPPAQRFGRHKSSPRTNPAGRGHPAAYAPAGLSAGLGRTRPGPAPQRRSRLARPTGTGGRGWTGEGGSPSRGSLRRRPGVVRLTASSDDRFRVVNSRRWSPISGCCRTKPTQPNEIWRTPSRSLMPLSHHYYHSIIAPC